MAMGRCSVADLQQTEEKLYKLVFYCQWHTCQVPSVFSMNNKKKSYYKDLEEIQYLA